MEERILRFISALRASGVRVSLAESADGLRAVRAAGVGDRNRFRVSLRAALVKERRGLAIFDQLFPVFFDHAAVPSLPDVAGDLSPQEAELLADALGQFSESLRRTIERLLRGESLSDEELERLGRAVGLQQVDDLRYREWIIERMRRALRLREVQEALAGLEEALLRLGMQGVKVRRIRSQIDASQRALEGQLSSYAGQRLAGNMAARPRSNDVQALMARPFDRLSQADMERLRHEVRRLAAALRSTVALRQKHARSGHLDAKATLRANLRYASVPMELRHRDRHLKPKLVVVCDVSASMRQISELMLSLLHALQDQVRKTHAFAFIDRLEYISPDLARGEAHQAVTRVLARMPAGYYNTDLGSSLADFDRRHLALLDSRTTFIVVGDGRNNFNEPRLDLFDKFVRRSRRALWLTPEPRPLWGTGDSDMHRYAERCGAVFVVTNLGELAAAVDRLLAGV
ncbi:MAG: hypothetical protein A2Z30_07255 [Chloroflexi bacterium RBG_16_64_43]|nr:MAG: hypothetical protein A2Z30_07255 [Chloroflexi bacterium RBG_16_64_43]